MIKLLKGALLLLCALAMTFNLSAQGQQYFVYLQSDHAQPFYVRYGGKLLSSSDKGYLILSKVPAGTVVVRIGFAKSDVPEQQYHIRLSGQNDQGYMIKKDGDGYSLYNLQSFAAVKADPPAPKEEVVNTIVPPPAPAPVEAAPVALTIDSGKQTVSLDTSVAAPRPVDSAKAMMAAVQKDIDSTFANKPGVEVSHSRRGGATTPAVPAAPVVAAAPAPKPGNNKFSQALDQVLGDDRTEEPVVEETPVVAVDTAATVVVDSVATPAPKKGRKKHHDREPLTAEEQQILSDVMAQEKQAGDADSVATVGSTDTALVAASPKKKARKKHSDDPAFIDFQDDASKQAAAAAAAAAPAVTAPVAASDVAMPSATTEETPAPPKKKRRSHTSEVVDSVSSIERPNNVVVDSTSGYAVSDLNIDHPKKKKRKSENVDSVAAPVTESAKPASSLKMINSDCAKTLDDDGYHKLLRRFVAAKDDDGMIDVFTKQTKGICLQTSQIKSLVQLLGTDGSRYRLLDYAYPKVYDTENFASLESVLTDDYYKGRFRAMLHK
jgi:hypothetical protein